MSSKEFFRDDAMGQRIQPLALRSREAAQALGISLSTLERLTRSGEIPAVKLNRINCYSVATLKAWLEAKQAKSTRVFEMPVIVGFDESVWGWARESVDDAQVEAGLRGTV